MPTGSQDKEFAKEMEASVDETTVKMSFTALDNAIAWIANNLIPEDVFEEKDLEAWAENNGYVKE